MPQPPRIGRRRFLRAIGASGVGAATFGILPAGAKRCNHLLVTLDTVRRDHLGCYGYDRPTSPCLDAFAAESLVFDEYHSLCNTTIPSHVALLSGKYPWSHSPGTPGVLDQELVSPGLPTIAGLFKAAGYRTLGVTSVSFLSAETLGSGFDAFHDPEGAHEERADRTVSRAVEMLRKAGASSPPFFAWVHLFDAHYPYLVNDRVPWGRSGPRLREGRSEEIGQWMDCDLVEEGTSNEAARRCGIASEAEREAVIDLYDGEIAFMDAEFGRLLSFLDGSALRDRTIVTVVSDHGESLFDNADRLTQHAFIDEPVMRAPFLVRHPDYRPRRVSGIVQNVDIPATLLEWSGLGIPTDFDGRSVASLSDSFGGREAALYCESGGRFVGIRKGPWKLRSRVAVAPESLTPPHQWEVDARERPEIEWSPPPSFEYEDTGGMVEIEWRMPKRVGGHEIAFTCVQMAEQGAPGGERNIGRRMGGGNCMRVLSLGAHRRAWNQVAALSPFFARVVAYDYDQRVLAASRPALLSFAMDADASVELFDLQRDPRERVNVSSAKPEACRELAAGIEDVRLKVAERLLRVAEKPREAAPDSEARHQLRALGYR